MGTYTRHTCTKCGSADVECDDETCKCNLCGHMGPKRRFAKYHGSTACDVPQDSQSVPRRNKRWRKKQRSLDDE